MKNWRGEGGRKVIKSMNNCYTRREKGYEQEVEFEEEEHNKNKMKINFQDSGERSEIARYSALQVLCLSLSSHPKSFCTLTF